MDKSSQNQTNQPSNRQPRRIPALFALIPRAVFEDLPTGKLKFLDVAIYGLIAMHCGGKGYCWPSHNRLAKLTGRKRKAVGESIKRLEAAKRIKREFRKNGGSKLLYLVTQVPRLSGKTNGSGEGHITNKTPTLPTDSQPERGGPHDDYLS